ncbi:ABC transporter permease [Celeribacter sp.]|uniref:ABC transporter permease n=1 Tax=Celeribacter sp. TaxID=1890673 RepID=UPI003A915E61
MTDQATATQSGGSARVFNILQGQGILLAFVALCIVLSLSSEFFLTWNNWTNILRQTAINGILAIGVTFVILTKGIDLSVGSILALSGAVAASFAVTPDPYFIGFAIVAALAVGALAGAVNGVLVAWLNIPAFVVTLGMLSVARGATYIYTDGRPISNLSPAFLWFGKGAIFGIPVPIFALALVFGICWFALRYTIFGRHVYAVGGSEKASRTSGIRTKKVIMSTYVISGLLAGLAGLILTARTTAALPQAGVAYELDAIAAVVIGGTSLSGGRGTLIGTMFGALIIGTINNGLDLMGVSSYYQQVVKGTIIVGAVLLDVNRKA